MTKRYKAYYAAVGSPQSAVGSWQLAVGSPPFTIHHSPFTVGEVGIEYDPEDRSVAVHPKLQAALDEHPAAKAVFDGLSPSRRHEIVRYIAHLKSTESVERNVARAIAFLKGEERFVGRDKP